MGHRLQQFLPFTQPLPPHLFRHQMLTYLTSKGPTAAQIQLISGHESKKNLEVYQHLSLESVDKAYQDAVPECGDLRRFLWDFTYLCWANPNNGTLPVNQSSAAPSESPATSPKTGSGLVTSEANPDYRDTR
jgi:hypothetical protein